MQRSARRSHERDCKQQEREDARPVVIRPQPPADRRHYQGHRKEIHRKQRPKSKQRVFACNRKAIQQPRQRRSTREGQYDQSCKPYRLTKYRVATIRIPMGFVFIIAHPSTDPQSKKARMSAAQPDKGADAVVDRVNRCPSTSLPIVVRDPLARLCLRGHTRHLTSALQCVGQRAF